MGDPNSFVASAPPIQPPTLPKPCAYFPTGRRTTVRAPIAVNTDFDNEKQYLDDLDGPYKSASQSSSEFAATLGGGGGGSPVFDLEKAILAREHKERRRSSRGSPRRSSHHQHHHQHQPHQPMSKGPHRIIHTSSTQPADPATLQPETIFDAGAAAAALHDDDEDDVASPGRAQQERHAVRILLFLSGPCVLLSLLNLTWTFVALFITALTQPVRICARRPNISQQISGLLGPSLNLQLRAILIPLAPHADEDASYHALKLVMVHLLSPVAGLGVMLCAWVLGVYWVSSVVIGDPAGQDKRDDGREAVLGLRGVWERWLMRCVEEEV